MIRWIFENRQWLFSGVGVTVLVGLLVLARRVYRWWMERRRPRPAVPPTGLAPRPAQSETYPTAISVDGMVLAREAFETSTYSQWAGDMQHANRDGQLVGVVGNFGHVAERFDSKEKFLLPKVVSEYMDVGDFKPPLATEDYVEFEFSPTQDGRRIWLRVEREGVLAIEVWCSWSEMPWDYLLAEAYSSLVCLRDQRLMKLFQSNGAVPATLTLGNLLITTGGTPDVNVTVRGLRLNLLPPGDEVRGDRPRFPSIQYECHATGNSDPWECAKAFVKRALTNTGALHFEERLAAVDKDTFLGMYFDTPGAFRRPQAARRLQA